MNPSIADTPDLFCRQEAERDPLQLLGSKHPPMKLPKDKAASVPEDIQGRWVAWDAQRKSILAVADDYLEIIRMVEESGEKNAFVEMSAGVHPDVAGQSFVLLDDESSNIIDDVRAHVPEPEQWLDSPNERLWFKTPRDFVGTVDEPYLRNLLRSLRSFSLS